MSEQPSFEQALATLEIDSGAGPRGAKRAYMLQLAKHGPEPSAEDSARFLAAYNVLKDEEVWPKTAASPVEQRERRLPARHSASNRARVVPRKPVTAPEPVGGGFWGGDEAPMPRVKMPVGRPTRAKPKSKPEVISESPEAEAPPLPEILKKEDVQKAVARLEKVHGHVIDGVDLMRLAESDGGQKLYVWLTSKFGLGDALAVAAATTLLLELMTEDHDLSLNKPRVAIQLTADLFIKAPNDPRALAGGQMLQRAFDKWMTAAEIQQSQIDLSSVPVLRANRSLASLPGEFPVVLIGALADSVRNSDNNISRAAFEPWLAQHPEEVQELQVLMMRFAPALLGPVQDLFPRPEDAKGFGLLAQYGVPNWALPSLAITLILSLSLAAASADRVFDHAASSSTQDKRAQICEYAGDGQTACVWAFVVSRGIGDNDCPLLSWATPRLTDSVANLQRSTGGYAVNLAEQKAIMATADSLVSEALETCSGL